MLGAVVDFSQMGLGKILVSDKPSGLEDITALVDQMVSMKKVPLSMVETLRGRLLYAAGHPLRKCTQVGHLADFKGS